jgi:hypothetical protein
MIDSQGLSEQGIFEDGTMQIWVLAYTNKFINFVARYFNHPGVFGYSSLYKPI